jgi:tetratricopeptide (TPR) repeat protein
MKDMEIKILQRQKTRICIGWVALAMVLPALCGCATYRTVEQEPVGQEPVGQEPSVTQGPTVTRLVDGRQGFLITEVSKLDVAAGRDFERAVAMLDDGHYGRAIDLLEKVIEQSPGVTAPYINLAIAYRHLDKLEQAEAHLKTALDLVPWHPVACNEYGLLYRKTGRFGEARAIYEKTLARFPEYYPVHRNLGILCDLYLNDLECALEHYEIYGRARPEDEQVQLWIVDLHNRLKSR